MGHIPGSVVQPITHSTTVGAVELACRKLLIYAHALLVVVSLNFCFCLDSTHEALHLHWHLQLTM